MRLPSVSKTTIAIVVVLVVASVGLGFGLLLPPRPLRITITNRSGAPLEGLSILCRGSDGDATTTVPTVAAASAVTLRPVLSEGENDVSLIGPDGSRYTLLGYVEGNPGGTVQVIVEQLTGDVLSGRVVDKNRYSPSGESALEPDE